MLHRSYLCSIARPAIHSHPKNRHAVRSPRISEWTRVDMTRSTLSRTHSVTEAAAQRRLWPPLHPAHLTKAAPYQTSQDPNSSSGLGDLAMCPGGVFVVGR